MGGRVEGDPAMGSGDAGRSASVQGSLARQGVCGACAGTGKLLDTEFGVNVDVLGTGRFPGDDKPKPGALNRLSYEPAYGRAGLTFAKNLDLDELVALTEEEYVERAVRLSQDLERLAELRRGLRPRMERSPLRDAPRFARAMENAYRAMWRNWCAREPR